MLIEGARDMTHSMTIELPEVSYQSLKEEAEQEGSTVESVAARLLESLTSDRKLNDDEFERLADELADYVEASLPPDAKPLSDYAMSREGLYDDHL